jgi:hypothetical protein
MEGTVRSSSVQLRVAKIVFAVLLITSAACTESSTPAESADPTSKATFEDATPRYRQGVHGVTIADDGCALEGLESPVETNDLRFDMWNSTAQYPITFDIGRIDPVGTYEDLVAFVDAERAAGAVGVLRPPYFDSPLRGVVAQGNGMNIPSGRLVTMLSTVSDPAVWEPVGGSDTDLTGTYAVVCYRGPAEAREPIGVVGPVVVR